jgi:hypothetical protein
MCINRFLRNSGSTDHLRMEPTPQNNIKVSAIPRRKLEMRKYCCVCRVLRMVRSTVNLKNLLLGRTFYFPASASIWQIKHRNYFNVCSALCKSTEQIWKRQNRLCQENSPPDLPCFPKTQRKQSNTMSLKSSSATIIDKPQ